MIQRQKFKQIILCGWLLFSLLSVPVVAAAADANKETLKKDTERNRTELLQAIKNSIAVEADILEELKKRLGRLDILKKAVFIEINAYNIQNSAHSNLLIQSATPITDLVKALDENRLSLNTLDDKIKDFTKRRDAAQELHQQTQDQISLSERQVIEIQNSGWSKAEKASLLAGLDKLIQPLAEKRRLVESLLEG